MDIRNHDKGKVSHKILSTAGNTIKKIVVVSAMLSPGILLDIMYHMEYFDIEYIKTLMQNISSITGVKYCEALKILGGTVGVVLTMVNLFLATSINLAQRREDNIYGIPRSELEEIQTNHYTYMRRVTYIAPLLIIIFLNLSMCISGYLLYVYCYAFYFIYFRMHEQSYNVDCKRSIVVKRIIKKYENSTDGNLIDMQVTFEKMGLCARAENNWNDMAIIYRRLMEELEQGDLQSIYSLSSEFFYYLFFYGDTAYGVEARRFIRDLVCDFDKKSHPTVQDKEWVMLYSIMDVAVMYMIEADLISLLEGLLNFVNRKHALSWQCSTTSKENEETLRTIDSHTIQLQRTLICVLLECRFKYCPSEGGVSLILASVAKKIWCAINTPKHFEELKLYDNLKKHYSEINFKEIIEDLEKDYKKGTMVSTMAKIAATI